MFFPLKFSCAVLLLLAAPWKCAARVLNITNLENCQDMADAAVGLKTVSYHIDAASGVCDTVHGEFEVKAVEHNPRVLTMTLYKCPDASSSEVCKSNPTVHEETLDCQRLISDDSGPWAMFSAGIARSNCGKQLGVFSMDYSTLTLNNIITYLDIHDTDFGRYRMRMVFVASNSNALRACLDLDFKLMT